MHGLIKCQLRALICGTQTIVSKTKLL